MGAKTSVAESVSFVFQFYHYFGDIPYFNGLYDKLESNCYQSSYFLSKAMELNKWGVGVWAAEATISVDIIFVLLHTYII